VPAAKVRASEPRRYGKPELRTALLEIEAPGDPFARLGLA